MAHDIRNLPDFLHFQWIIRLLNNVEKHVFHNMAYGLLVFGLVILLFNLLKEAATYGKFYKKSQLHMNPRLAWFIQELPSFLVPVNVAVFSDSPHFHQLPNRIILGCFIIHYIQRALIYPSLMKGVTPFPVQTFLFAIVFCTFNGYLQAGYLVLHADLGDNWIYNPIFYLGLFIFFAGMYINVQSDDILRHLRKPGEKGYKIPKGGWFEYVSSANYFGEIVEWTGFAIACPTLPGVVMPIFTFCNLASRALHCHRFYRNKFKEYPKNRKAVIPFVL